MNKVIRHVMAGLLLGASLLVGRSEASVIINGTRVVYPASNKEVTVKLTNKGDKPVLVQVWLDDGDNKSTPENAKAPFTVFPPVFRMEPGKGQAVRLLYTREPLPQDKESVFWLNMLEVPPRLEGAEDRNLMQFAFRTRIKVFFRPDGLRGDPVKAGEKLAWKLVAGEGGKGLALQATNPTPYHVNFSRIGLKAGDRIVAERNGGMVAPGATATFPLQGLQGRPASETKVDFTTISDFGGRTQMLIPLSP
ncbi:fimbria/pilus periplasmic chaperone [[Pseudomonas] boreopolis]|uniref:fimbria/pilus periplasmic chaperone n=1 Tax=Xanthomonas boreopolis TaxID=86183 RepID=UPI003D9AC1AD